MGCSPSPDSLYSRPPTAAVTVTSRGCDTGFGVTNLIHARALPAAVVAVVFAIVARAMGSVTDGGALAGVLVAFVLMLAGGFAGFIPLLTLFLLTVISTRWGYGRKQRLGVAERKRGRKASQVLANLGAAAACALPAVWFPAVERPMLGRLRCGAGGGCRRHRFQRNGTGDCARGLHGHGFQ